MIYRSFILQIIKSKVLIATDHFLILIVAGNDDELNTIAAGTATGLLYKSTSGLKKCGVGGAVGFALSGLYCLVTAKDKLEAMFRR